MSAADVAIQYALAQVGKPYVWGATGPDGFDCSGLVWAAYNQAGVSLGRTTYQQILNGQDVPQSDLAPGDLVFPDIGHVQLYLGNGQIVEAAHQGTNIRVVNMWGFWKARRVTAPSSGVYTSSAGTDATSKPASSGILGSTSDLIHSAGHVAATVTSGAWWKRLGLGAAGAAVIYYGYSALTKEGKL